MKTVFVAENPAHAHLVAGLLEEQGVRCVIEGEMLFGIRGDLGLTPQSLPQVAVREEDFERARAVIERRDPPPPDAADALPSAPTTPARTAFEMLVLVALLVTVLVVAVIVTTVLTGFPPVIVVVAISMLLLAVHSLWRRS